MTPKSPPIAAGELPAASSAGLPEADIDSLIHALKNYPEACKVSMIIASVQEFRTAATQIIAAKDAEIARLKQPTDVSCKVVTCQIYGHQIGLHYCENCNVTAEDKVEKS